MEQLENCFVEQEYSVSILVPFTLAGVAIHFQDYSPLLPGDRVTRMGHHGWCGQILQIDTKSVLVEWGTNRYKKQQWLDRSEVYPLDSSGHPRIPGQAIDPLTIAQRARIVLSTDIPNNENMEKHNQLRLF